MSEQETKLDGPDVGRGAPLADLAEGGMILGHAAGESVVLARTGGAWFAIGAEGTHYHRPPPEGPLVPDTVRCPCPPPSFPLRPAEPPRPPPPNPVPSRPPPPPP